MRPETSRLATVTFSIRRSHRAPVARASHTKTLVADSESDPTPQPRANPSGRPSNPYDDIFGKMFETGAKQRDDYQKGVESIFDPFKRGMDRQR
jgi:hypothetical protein